MLPPVGWQDAMCAILTACLGGGAIVCGASWRLGATGMCMELKAGCC